MLRLVLVLTLVFSMATVCWSQSSYPFTDAEGNRDILAYWYNVPKSENGGFYSTLQIYGIAHGDPLKVTAQVYDRSGTKVLERTFTPLELPAGAVAEPPYKFERKDGAFYVECEVDEQKESPARIAVTVESAEGKRVKEITCRYHRISGHLTDFDGSPVKAYVAFGPDAFCGQIGVWSDDKGRYEVELPERTYNSVQANNDGYKKTILEPWGWHVIVDRDERMDFRIGTAEVYNLNVWTNNYSRKTFLLSFRPMTLANCPSLFKKYKAQIDGAERDVVDIAPELESADITVTINGKPAKVLSTQRYYETSDTFAMPAYLVQVSAAGIDTRDKTTFLLEYDKKVESDGEVFRVTSMAFCHVLFNRAGFSPYF